MRTVACAVTFMAGRPPRAHVNTFLHDRGIVPDPNSFLEVERIPTECPALSDDDYSDIWHTYAGVDPLRDNNEVLARWCAEAGRDPAAIERASAVNGDIDPRLAEELVHLGVSLFVIEFAHPPYDFSILST